MSQNRSSAGIFARIIPLLFFMVMIWVLVAAVSTAVKILYSWLAIPLLIIALFLNYSVVTDFFGGLIQGIKEDTGKGLLKAGAVAIGYPFVFAYLALKAWTKRALGSKRPSVRETKDGKKGDYIKYEEVQEEEDFLDLEDLDKVKEKVKQTHSNNEYDDLFS